MMGAGTGRLHRYHYGNWQLDSTLPLPPSDPHPSDEPPAFSARVINALLPTGGREIAPMNNSSGERIGSISALGPEHYRVDYDLGCGFTAYCPENTVTVDEGAVARAIVQHLLLNHVLPMTLGEGGHTVIHATAVATATGAIGFVGRSGVGKSTLSASFALNGVPLCADDALHIQLRAGLVEVVPGRVVARLRSPAAEHLLNIGPRRSGSGFGVEVGLPTVSHRLPLRALVALDAPPSVHPSGEKPLERVLSIRRAPAGEALGLVVPHAFFLNGTTTQTRAALFARYAALIATVPVFVLSYPRNFEVLAEVRAAVLDALDRLDHEEATNTATLTEAPVWANTTRAGGR